MATAKKLPSGAYRVQVYIGKDADGRRKYKSFTGKTKKAAELAAAQWEIADKPKKGSFPTLTKAIDAYIDSRKSSVSPSTVRGYRIIQRSALGDLADVPINLIDAETLQRHFDGMVKKYAHKSRVNQHGLITAAMSFGGVSAPKINLGREAKTGIAVPKKSECEKLLTLLIGTKIELQALLALTCSLTQSEIGALTPAHVDGNRLTVRGARIPDENNLYVISEFNKNSTRTRSVIMPDYLAAKMAERCCGVDRDGLLFPERACGVLAALKKLCRQNGMPEYTMHSLRHAFAAWMHAEGVPDKYIQKAGGWKTSNVMKSVYQYAFEDEADAAKMEVNRTFNLPGNTLCNTGVKK